MTISRYSIEEALAKIQSALVENNIPLNEKISAITQNVVKEHYRLYGAIEDTYCNQVIEQFKQLSIKNALTPVELDHLSTVGGSYFVKHSAAIVILKDSDMCTADTLRTLIGPAPAHIPQFYPDSIAKALVLLHQAGFIIDHSDIDKIIGHENPATLVRPLELLLANNCLKPEYAALVFTHDEHTIRLIAALEKANVKFDLHDDILAKDSHYSIVLQFLAFQNAKDSDKTLLNPRNVELLQPIKNDNEALKSLLDRLNNLYFMKNDYTQKGFESQVYYATKKLPFPVEIASRLLHVPDFLSLFQSQPSAANTSLSPEATPSAKQLGA